MSEESTIVEVLDDGTIYAFDMDVCDQEANNVIELLHEKEGKLFNFDFSAADGYVSSISPHLLEKYKTCNTKLA
jgi:hypothetical protein